MLLTEEAIDRGLRTEFGTLLKVAVSDCGIEMNQMTTRERAYFETLKVSSRRETWKKGRMALKRLRTLMGEEQETIEILFPNRRFSLSHSGGYAVAIGTRAQDQVGIGIDLEFARPIHSQAALFYLSPRERAWLERIPAPRRPAFMLQWWTIKEALFKSDPENRYRSLLDYEIENPEGWAGRVIIDQGHRLEIRYAGFALGSSFLSVAVSREGSRYD